MRDSRLPYFGMKFKRVFSACHITLPLKMAKQHESYPTSVMYHDGLQPKDAHGQHRKISKLDLKEPVKLQREYISQASISSPAKNLAASSDEFEAGEFCEEYLSSVLFDFGLTLSPGGTGVELDQSQFADNEVKQLESVSSVFSNPITTKAGVHLTESEKPAATTFPHSKFRKICEFSSRTTQDCVKGEVQAESPLPPIPALELLPGLPEADLIPSSSKQAEQDTSELKRKVKLYEIPELDDPDKERRRVNAVNARRNRIKQKQKTRELQDQYNTLKEVNKKFLLAIRKINQDYSRLTEEQKEATNLIKRMEENLKEKKREIRDQRERHVLFRGHLEIIASSLDEDNPAKKLILSLLRKIPTDSLGGGESSKEVF